MTAKESLNRFDDMYRESITCMGECRECLNMYKFEVCGSYLNNLLDNEVIHLLNTAVTAASIPPASPWENVACYDYVERTGDKCPRFDGDCGPHCEIYYATLETTPSTNA